MRLAVVLLFVGIPLFGDSSAPAPSAEEAKPSRAPKPAQKGVYEGMMASELQALIGKPDKVVPVDTPEGKKNHAEVWIYKRLKSTSTDTVTVGTKPVTTRVKQGDNYVDVVVSNEPVIKNRVTEIYQVASFLIIQGRFIKSTQTEEKRQYFL